MSLATFWAGIQAAAGAAFNIAFSSGIISVGDFRLSPNNAAAGIEIDADGTIDRVRSTGTDQNIWTWATGAGFDANDYDFMWDSITGTLDLIGDPQDVWINGGSTIFFTVLETGIGTTSATGTLRIRPAGGGADISTASGSLVAESTP